MDSLRTEEEQVAALKQFWKEYGSAILMGIVLSLAAVYGFKAWKAHNLEQAEASSGLYQELLDLSLRQPGVPMSDTQKASFESLLKTLDEDHQDTVYAQFAALLKARQAVADNDLQTAHDQLEWVLLQKPSAELDVIARIRLARVLLSMGADRAEEALVLLNQLKQPGAFVATYQEARGDALLALKRRDQAREAYQAAADAAVKNGEPRPLVTLKLEDLAKPEGKK